MIQAEVVIAGLRVADLLAAKLGEADGAHLGRFAAAGGGGIAGAAGALAATPVFAVVTLLRA